MTPEELDTLARLERAAADENGRSWSYGDLASLTAREAEMLVTLRPHLPDLLRLARERDALLAVALAALARQDAASGLASRQSSGELETLWNVVKTHHAEMMAALAAARPILDADAGKAVQP